MKSILAVASGPHANGSIRNGSLLIEAAAPQEQDAYWQGFANFAAGQTEAEQPTWQHRNGWLWAQERELQKKGTRTE